ncbi:MAG: glucose-6-phosphate isomerase [Alphaproteobacteria bacterium]|nr:glucose-6-phosphate isomerase [Alphaproteobacteria bacterium]
MDVIKLAGWKRLESHYNAVKRMHLRDMFSSAENNRFKQFSIVMDDPSEDSKVLFDYSKNRITEETVNHFISLVKEVGLEQKREQMFAGEPINNTENRSVLHTVLRDKSRVSDVYVGGENINKNIDLSLDVVRIFSNKVRAGDYMGATGKPITDVVHIGIGGSDLGPRMVVGALSEYVENAAENKPNVKVHFVSNVDGSDVSIVLKNLNPETTLFVIVSKAFTTDETLTNAASAKKWLEEKLDKNAALQHFVAVTSFVNNAQKFGISECNIFEFADWVGGRYSLWSPVGLSIAIAIGMDNFEKLLEGAFAADTHFLNAPLDENIPVIMALLGIWYTNFFGCSSHAVLPYDHNLKLLPSYLQQLEMESNGKSVCKDGKKVSVKTCPVIFGGAGTDAQHSFFQLLHQGTEIVPCDFIAAANSNNNVKGHHEKLLANFLAQPQALMMGSDNRDKPHKNFEGNRPSNVFLMNRLTPYNIGMLLAFYEHKVFVQGVVWDVNSFDQWGVELGKKLAKNILPALQDDGEVVVDTDDSTKALTQEIKQMRGCN